MTIIKPFKGYRYDPKKAGDLAKVITPPYDVINKKQQASYYKRHPYNFIRLDLGKTSPADTGKNNRYTRADAFLRGWIDKGVLKEDSPAAVYVYSQGYQAEGRAKERLGFISLARLEEDRTKGFLPHERTFKGPKLDRLELMKETGANLSPIYSILIDENRKVINILKGFVKKRKPDASVNFEGTTNRIWLMTDAATIEKLRKSVQNKRALIADGHHRYEVALEYREYLKNRGGNSDHVMMYFATSDPSGMSILPTHRMVEGLSPGTFGINIDKIKKYFDIINVGSKDKMFARMKADKRHTIGVYLGGRHFMCLSLKRRDASGLIRSKNSSYWRNLDVVILHHLLFEKALGINGARAEKAVTFTRDPSVALKWAAEGKGASFFLVPPVFDEIKNIVKRRERMPHKTTYFYPKPPSGLVINKIE